MTGRPLDELLPRDATAFTRELVEGAVGEQAELDGLIERHAEGWTLDRIAPLERNIMRVALYEMLHRDDVPDEVAIDEAVEAAKELCGADAPEFVNGDPRRRAARAGSARMSEVRPEPPRRARRASSEAARQQLRAGELDADQAADAGRALRRAGSAASAASSSARRARRAEAIRPGQEQLL